MRLCAATLGAFSKYPCASAALDPVSGRFTPRSKFGYYQQDRAAFAGLARCLGLSALPSQDGSWRRHPLAFLVEAADDICYLIVDIEDGIKTGVLGFPEVEAALMRIVGTEAGYEAELGDLSDRISYLRSKAIGTLVDETVAAFVDRERELLAGEFDTPLLEVVDSRDAVREVRRMCVDQLYTSHRKIQVEIGGFAVVRGLLEVYTEALLAWERVEHDIDRLPYLHQRTLRLLPEGVRAARRRYDWLLRLLDYVTGMTNRFAVAQHRTLRGADLGLDPLPPPV